MKRAQRGFGEFEMIRQQLGYGKGRFRDATTSMIVSLSDHVIKLMSDQSSYGASVDKLPGLIGLFPQRRSEERVQGCAVDIAKRENHSVRHGARGKREWSADGVFETRARFWRTARASQANHSRIVVFGITPVSCGILPLHVNRRGLKNMAELLLDFGRGCRRDAEIRRQKDDQSLLARRQRLRAANACAHAEHAGEGEDVCNTRHSTHSLVQKI